MIIESVLGNLSEDKYSSLEVDYLDIEWYNSAKKIDRLKTKSGVEVGIRLCDEAVSKGLRQDDVLFADEKSVIAVSILPCKALVMTVTDIHLLPKFCYEIGNRHAPFFYGDSHHEFVTPYDKPIQVMLEKIGIDVQVKEVKINLSHSISSSNGGGHSHSHGDDEYSHSHSHSH